MLCCCLFWQTSDSDEYSVLDRDSPERAAAVAGQGADADGLAAPPLLKHVIEPSNFYY